MHTCFLYRGQLRSEQGARGGELVWGKGDVRVLSDAAEYAVRAAVWLAQTPQVPQKVRDIAAGTRAAPGYLIKALQALQKAGILSAQRGIRGGFALIRDPYQLTVLEVINAVDPLERIDCCPLGLEAHAECLCALHQHLDDAVAAAEAGLGSRTIGELLAGADGAWPLRGPQPPPADGAAGAGQQEREPSGSPAGA